MRLNTRQLALDAMLSAMCAVLGYLSVDLGQMKLSLESLPVLVAALLFGPLDGLAVGGIGTLLYQLLRYGLTVTTPLWILPYLLCGLLVGFAAKKSGFALAGKRLALLMAAAQLMILLLNTFALVVDGKIFGYYSPAFITGALVWRLLLALGKAVAFTLLLPPLLRALKRNGKESG